MLDASPKWGAKNTPAELVPLNEIDSRPEAMRRCIGPLTTLGAITVIEAFRNSTDFNALQNQSHDRTPQQLIDTFNVFNIIDHLSPRYTGRQQRIFERHTYYGARAPVLREALSNQASLLQIAFIPGICDNLGVNPEDLPEVSNILRREDANRSIRSLSFSANAAYEGSLFSAPIHRRTKSTSVLENLQMSFIKYSGEEKIPADLKEPISATELFRVDEEGQIRPSLRAIKILRMYLKLDNAEKIKNNGLKDSSPLNVNQSIGCPASLKTVKMLPDDLTELQMDEITKGTNPIASYCAETQELTILRSPITEFNYLVADYLSPSSLSSVE